MADTTAKSRYQKLALRRQSYLDRARDAARLTIPSLLPPEGHNGTSRLPQPYQGFGAHCVATLSSRIAAALMPPGRGFMKLVPTPEALVMNGETTVPSDLEIGLAKSEKLIETETVRANWRRSTNLSTQHLVVAGNVLEILLPDSTISVMRLDQYVVVRDPSDNIVELIVEEQIYPDALPEDLQAAAEPSSDNATNSPDTVALYTWVRLEEGMYKVHQEIGETPVPDSEGEYEPENLPFFPLRYAPVLGESYGRGKVEEHIADFIHFDSLSKAIRDGAAMASRNVTLIRPGAQSGLNLVRKVSRADNGDFVIGNPEDISMLNYGNQTGLQITQAELLSLRRDLGQAFLLSASSTRDAERVTATEVRMAAEELEGILGGVYTMLSQDMMLSRVRRLIFQMRASEKLPPFDDETIEPLILTGLDALGRESAVNAVVSAANIIQSLPEGAHRYVKWGELIKKLHLGLGIEDAVKTEDEVQKDIDREMAAQVAAQTATAAGQQAAQATTTPPQG